MAKEIAPTACPKCGEEKRWGSDTDVRPQQVRTMLLCRAFLSWLPSYIIAKNKKNTMTYRCGRCGYTEDYRED